MRIYLNNIFIISILICVISITSTPQCYAENDPIIITYSDYWPLFRTEKDGTRSGIFYEIVSEAMNSINVEIKWESYPWARCQNYVRTGKADAIMTVRTDERSEYTLTHPTPFYHKHLQLFTYKNNPQEASIDQVKTPEDIERTGLSIITYVGNGWNKNNIQSLGIKTYEASRPDNVWPMLAYKRGDIVIEWPVSAWIEIKKKNLSQKIVQTNGTVDCIPFHLLISKKSKYVEILPEFEKAIQTMTRNGRIDSIIKKYMQMVRQDEQSGTN
ncbi:substrate-binding periplasmic protein [Maridesulfovibrio salexigens]|uniref:Extracellular solute-binding protein family 3 n=1 Tax=Maridesulfovibrio salexigens (strain ATCC 14822 / DSM 2638 / NCIMB 8403 / VKM B-1763) TaxID=526222 RepID=C6BTX4_MARSD|nr:transporter substrate-binding domain-containing protein [Maridesulfovibrio salexigens]ACS79904.1 extracellular solute-binding protein family 3 [Maridesulfovibrio salexigens DSM 2638]